MALVTHIAFAVISIISVSFAAFFPSKNKLYISNLLTLGTIISGFIMLYIHPEHLGRTCISGIVYLGFMAAASALARKRLAVANQNAR